MRYSKTKTRTITAAVAAAVLMLLASACSSDGSGNGAGSTTTAAVFEDAAATTDAALPATTVTTTTEVADGTVFVVVPFTAANGSGEITISGGGSPVAEWFSNLPGEVSLDLVDADIDDEVSVVEELVSFWFFQDRNSGDVPPSIFVSASGEITDSVGTRYVVEAQPLPPAPETATTTTADIPETATTTTTVPGNTENPTTTTAVSEETATTTTTTTSSAVPETTTTSTTTPVVSLQVQVLNGSGVAGAAGRLTERLSQAGYPVLPPGNAQRYRSSAVYYAEGWETEAAEILETAGIDEIEEATPMPAQFSATEAAVIVLLGTDTAPAVAAEQTSLRPEPDFSVKLPLGDDIPRDRYVPGLANIQIFTQENDADPETFNYIHSLQQWLRYVANFREDNLIDDLPEDRGTYRDLLAVYDSIEEVFDWLGFTPQNVCGAPPGYSFTDLLQPTREFSEETQNHRGDAIFTTDRLIELHGGERINPEDNLEFYIREAAQTAHDALRLGELLDETEAPQLILCRALLAPSGEVPELANAVWYMLLTPGFQPRENLISQGTYHVKEISRNGNFAYMIVCHPAIGARFVALHWREAGYRAEVVEDLRTSGCQAAFEEYDDYFAGTTPSGSGDYFTEDTISFSFGERVFSATDMQRFPRAG